MKNIQLKQEENQYKRSKKYKENSQFRKSKKKIDTKYRKKSIKKKIFTLIPVRNDHGSISHLSSIINGLHYRDKTVSSATALNIA